MASYKGVNGVMTALEEFFKRRLPNELKQGSVNARVALLGSADVAKPITGNVLGIYLHRITVDPYGRNRFFPPRGLEDNSPRPELPVNLHFLLIAAGSSATIEANLLSWAMVELANETQLDVSQLSFRLALSRLPPLPEHVDSYAARLSVQASATATEDEPVDPAELSAMQLGRLDQEDVFAAAIDLSVKPGEVLSVKSSAKDYLAVKPV